MILVFQDNILFPSYQTMETIFLTFGDFDVDTMASATNTKVNTSFIDNCINRNKFPILGEYASQRSRALSAKTLRKTLATVNNTVPRGNASTQSARSQAPAEWTCSSRHWTPESPTTASHHHTCWWMHWSTSDSSRYDTKDTWKI